jgi:hypothetical protein
LLGYDFHGVKKKTIMVFSVFFSSFLIPVSIHLEIRVTASALAQTHFTGIAIPFSVQM